MLKTSIGLIASIASFLFIANSRADENISNIQTRNIALSGADIANINIGGVLNGNITMNNSSQSVNFNGGAVNGTINGGGKIFINSNTTLNGNVGGSASILSLEINEGAILNSSNRNITSGEITINKDATFNYGSGTINSAVEGKSVGLGNFVFNNTRTTNFNIGQNNKLANINILDSITVTLGGNIAATTINIGKGVSGRLKNEGKNITADNIKIFKGATLEISAGGIISGAINGAEDGQGTVQFSGTSPISQSNSLGVQTKLAQVLISNETTLNIDSDIILNANEIQIGEGGTVGVIAPVLNQNAGIIGADANSIIKLNTNAVFNYNGGTINGTVRGTSSNRGTFNVNQNYVSNFEIGKSFDLAALSVASGKILTANANISANNINIAGTLDLSSSAKTITGNLTTSGGNAVIDLGAFTHNISGNFSAFAGDVLKVKALNNNIGGLKISGNALLANFVGLKISFNPSDIYLSNNANFAIISGASGNINAIGDNNIDVNNSGLNESGLLTFHTTKSAGNLFLVVERKSAKTFSDNELVAKIYNNIDQVGGSATLELRDLQKIIDNDTTSNQTREAILKSIIPQVNQDLNNSSFNSANSSANLIVQRLENIFFQKNNSINLNSFRNSTNFSDQENISGLDKLNFADERIFDDQGIWLQHFQTSAKQDDVGDFDGYNYSNSGLAIGVDQEIEQDLRLGISVSLAKSNIQSNSSNAKETGINSYQFNLYGGYKFAPYFISSVLGAAINQYNSTRQMPEMNLAAKARYNGQTYIAKFEAGMNFNYGLTIIPKIGLTAVENQIVTYFENGAGTLNLKVSNQHSSFLEGRIGSDFSYDNLKISSVFVRPRIKLSYGYDFLGGNQSSVNSFEGQGSSFLIRNSNIDKASFKYGFGLNLYQEEAVFLVLDYDVEKKSSYKSKSTSISLRYNF